MALESGTYIKDLVDTNPPGTDAISQGDDHIRLIKTVLQNSFPSTNNAAIIPDISGNGLKYLQVNSGATATQWSSIRQRGYVSRATIEYSSATAILIGAGEYEVDDGSTPTNYYWDSQLTFTIGSGGSNASSSAAGTSQWQYLYIDDSAISASPLVAASFLNSTTAPTYSHTKHGWYNGSDRCIFAFYIDSSGNIAQWFHDGGDYVLNSSIFAEGSLGASTSWQTETITIPDFANKAECNMYMVNHASSHSYQYWRVNGTTPTNAHLLSITEGDETETMANNVTVYVDSNKQFQVLTNNATVSTQTAGYFLPGGM